jgi:hypothetical protein
MGYKTWMHVTADGTIESVVWRLGDTAPPDHPVLCTDPKWEPELRKSAGANLFYNGKKIKKRHPVRWLATPATAAVGETIRLQLVGLPDDFRRNVTVQIGEERHKLKHPYEIRLGWKNAARVGVQIVDEPEITQTIFMHVQFVERRQK